MLQTPVGLDQQLTHSPQIALRAGIDELSDPRDLGDHVSGASDYYFCHSSSCRIELRRGGVAEACDM
jgi:hypothetical protein